MITENPGRHIGRMILLLLVVLFTACEEKNPVPKEYRDSDVILYSTEELENWGLLNKAIPLFEQTYRCRASVRTFKHGGAMIAALRSEKKNPIADVAIGLDNGFLQQLGYLNLFESCRPKNKDKIARMHLVDESGTMIPYAFGYLAIVYDERVIAAPPVTIAALTDHAFTGRLIGLNPETCGLGKGMVYFGVQSFGTQGYMPFWRDLKTVFHSVETSKVEAYRKFLQGEAPMVLSYSTRPCFHEESGQEPYIKAVIPEEIGLRFTDLAGMIRDCKNPERASEFMDFILSPEFQKLVPSQLWKYPVIESTPLPASFYNAPRIEKDDTSELLRMFEDGSFYSEWYKQWREATGK